MQTTQKFTLQILFPRLEHFNSDVANTLHLFTSCEGIQDRLGFWIPPGGFLIPGTGFQSLSVELGSWIPIVSGIPESLSCIPHSTSKNFRILTEELREFSSIASRSWSPSKWSCNYTTHLSHFPNSAVAGLKLLGGGPTTSAKVTKF